MAYDSRTHLSEFIIDKIGKITSNENEKKFLIELLQKELTYYAYAERGATKKDFELILDKYYPFKEEGT